MRKTPFLFLTVFGEMCWASPAPARGALFLRGVEHLYCIKP